MAGRKKGKILRFREREKELKGGKERENISRKKRNL